MSIFRKISAPVLLLCAIEIFLLLYFPPSLILEPAVTTGGDTHSHFMSAVVMRDAGSFFSPITWFYGNFGGFPLFLHYFPFPFLLMALASFIISLEVAFKLITLLAIIPLPAAVFYCLKRLGYPGQVSTAGAALCLPFLMMSENHMWGGNITSTLAGEFSFGISFILAIVLAGRLFTDAPRRRSLLANSLIEALIALCNGYPILYSGMASGYFPLRGRAIRYIVPLHALALGWTAFWLLPLMRYASWNTPFAHWWSFQSAFELFPPLLWPAIAGALIALGFQARKLLRRIEPSDKNALSPVRPEVSPGGTDRSCEASMAPGVMRATPREAPESSAEAYLWWHFGIALLGFGIAPHFGLVDIRFLPFAQIAIVMLGAIGWCRLILWLPRPNLWLSLFTAAMIVFSFVRSATVESWIRWNYSGPEAKLLAEPFRQATHFLVGSENSPRVVYEHSDITNGAGTVRAFEMLPYYSGRSTLEGLYMQSALSAPFVYYIQSEISETPTTPLTTFYYSRFNPERAAEHLRLFNVNQVIAVSGGTCNALDISPAFEPQAAFPPFRIYLLKDAEPSYVTPLRFQPRRIPERDWKTVQYAWFRKSTLKTPLIVADDNTPGDYWKTVPVFEGAPEDIPEIPISGPD
ncbi:MAG: 6-pyruvoyl-tetrahydropterin synthase-related protein, partial [Syntrophobacter sp.]